MTKNVILILAVTMMLAACPGGKPTDKQIDSPLCGPVSGFTISYFVYGEGEMVIIPLSKVRANTVFVIGLKPLDGFEDAQVTVTVSGAGAGWINNSGQRDSLPAGVYRKAGALEVGCVPNDPIGSNYKYEIKVEKGAVTNILDPRARVVN